MIEYNVGYTWDLASVAHYQKLNTDDYVGGPRLINEVYGALRSTIFDLPQARPDHRIPDISLDYAMACRESLRAADIRLNYTINGTWVGPDFDFHKFQDEYIRMKSILSPDIITIAHPRILEAVQHISKNKEIEISTIMGVRNMPTIKHFASMPTVTKICLDLYRNRDMSFLREATDYADRWGCKLELLANEFCMIASAPCNDIYRSSCYAWSNAQEKGGANDYPKKQCTQSRIDHGPAWLKAPFVLPQWVDQYQRQTGIHNFKITGRTHAPIFINKLAEAYMTKSYNGNLLELWMHLDNIGKAPEDYSRPPYTIYAEQIVRSKFIDRWFHNPAFRCSDHCDSTCFFCNIEFDKYNQIDYTPEATSTEPKDIGGII